MSRQPSSDPLSLAMGALLAVLFATASFSNLEAQDLRSAGCGNGSGRSPGLFQTEDSVLGPPSGDLDWDGVPEVAVRVVTGESATRAWSLLRPIDRLLEEIWTSPDLGHEIRTTGFFDVDLDGDDEVVVGTRGGVLVYDGPIPTLVHEIASGLRDVSSLTMIDLDADGYRDVVVCGDAGQGTGLHVYDYLSGDSIFASTEIGCSEVVAVDADLDGAVEIVVTDRSDPRAERVSVLATPSLAVESTFERPLGGRGPSVAGSDDRIAEEGFVCVYWQKRWIQGSWCGHCGIVLPCLRRTVYYFQQDCWNCTDPSQNWCNEPFIWHTQCFECACL